MDAKICLIRGHHFSSKALKTIKRNNVIKRNNMKPTNPIFKCFQPCFKTALWGLFSQQPCMKPSTFEIWFSCVDITCFLCLEKQGIPRLALNCSKCEIEHFFLNCRNVKIHVDWFLHLPGNIPMLALAWRLEKETFHQSVTCYCFHLFYCESNFNNFLKLKQV